MTNKFALKINSLQNYTQIADWYLSEHYFFLYRRAIIILLNNDV